MLVVIPARGGSKGVPGKNIKKLGGKPLIHYTIEAAREIFDNRDIFVSTDSEEIREEVLKIGVDVPFLRPASLSTDEASTYEVLLHSVNYMESIGIYHDTLILLQPTSPFRTAMHIKEALALYHDNLEMIVSVKETSANPYYVLREETPEGFLIPSKSGGFTRRQDCPKVWEINGAIYIMNVKALKQKSHTHFTLVKKYEMDQISSHDIDTYLDWDVAEAISKRNID